MRTVPIWNILVGNPGCDVEHDDAALAVDVVPISQTTKLLLSCSVPDIELDPSVILEYRKPAESKPIFQIKNVLLKNRAGGPQHQGLRCTSFRTLRSNGA